MSTSNLEPLEVQTVRDVIILNWVTCKTKALGSTYRILKLKAAFIKTNKTSGLDCLRMSMLGIE